MGGKRIKQGENFGKLTTVEIVYRQSSSGRKRPHWTCLCSCGNTTCVDSGNLRSGNTTQCCDCANQSRADKRRTHGMSYGRVGYDKLYGTWGHIRSRCYSKRNKRYSDYGGRGIKVCARWQDFANFAADMGEPPGQNYSIERIDNDGDYTPDNCKWIPMVDQSANRRNCIMIDYDGKLQNLAAHCRDLGLPYDTIKRRIHTGWNPVEALSKPIRRR